MSKKDLKAINEMLIHSKIDSSYGAGGSFGNGDDWYKDQEKLAEKGRELVKYIIEQLVIIK